MVFSRLGGVTARIIRPSRIGGSDSRRSAARSTSVAPQPRLHAVNSPSGMPAARLSSMAPNPIASDRCAPASTRDNTSRPNSSVPNGCNALGAAKRSRTANAVGSYGVNQMPAMDTATITTRMTSPALTVRARQTS